MIKFNFSYIKNISKEFIDLLKIFLSLTNKTSFIILFVISSIVIILESYTLSIVYGVSNSILNEEFEMNNLLLGWVMSKFSLNETNSSLVILIVLLLFIFLKNIFSIFIIFYKNNFFKKMVTTISQRLFDKFMKQNYKFFINKNSSELIANVLQDVGIAMRGFEAIFHILIEILLISAIFLYLIYMDKIVALVFILGALIFFIFYTFFTKKKLIYLSNQRLYLNEQIIKDLQQSFTSFREIIIYACQKLFSKSIYEKFKVYFSNIAITAVLQQASRILIEQAFIILIILIFLFINYFTSKNIIDVIPIFAVYLFAFLKILPSLNKLIIETQNYLYSKLFIKKINQNLNLNDENISENINSNLFEKRIHFKNVSYYFDESNKEILKDLNFSINKNEKIGFVGESGAGKTTILNLIMGFLLPKDGNIFIDNHNLKNCKINWQNLIGYVPQNVAILDDTLKKNITFETNEDKIDHQMLKKSIEVSGLTKFVQNNREGYETIIGEKGSKISGGEILRIGLARAIYSKADIFILDEFTSSLDLETEEEIINNIRNINKTFVIVSHRKSTLKYCDKIFKLENNKISEV